MKKKSLKSLKLNKKYISNLSAENIKGGETGVYGPCQQSEGCVPLTPSGENTCPSRYHCGCPIETCRFGKCEVIILPPPPPTPPLPN